MKHASVAGKVFRRVLLPAGLLLGAGLGLGCYFETSDDAAIIQLLRGTTAAAPVADLQLYFHGLSRLLAGCYQLWPALPWYSLLLYGLLYAATAAVFTVLDRLLASRVSAVSATALLVLLFLTMWVEHGLWFNYSRVPILLAGAGVLFGAQRPTSRAAFGLAVLAFGVGWLIRPSAAVLGLLVAMPGACWLSGRRAGPVLAAALLWALLGEGMLRLASGPQTQAYRTLDVLKSNINDYQLYHLTPTTRADSLGLRSVQRWMLSDSTLVNEALFRRAARFDARYFLAETAPEKLRVLSRLVAHDYFPALLLHALLFAWVAATPGLRGRRTFWLVQILYLGLVLALGLVLKLPPRVGLPIFNFWSLSNLIYLLREPRWAFDRRYASVLLVLSVAAIPYTYKTLHRRTVLQAERRQNEALRQRYRAGLPPGALLVTDVLPATYKAASPFEPLAAPTGSTWALAGWITADPSQARYRQALTGTRSYTESLRRLAARGPAVRWVLSDRGAALLNQQLKSGSSVAHTVRFLPGHSSSQGVQDTLRVYEPHVERLK